jgi:phosphoserine aminotransferase
MSKKIFFTPGPSALYYTVEEHLKTALKLQIPEISHRSSAYKTIHENAVIGLKSLFQLPEGYHIAFVSSATEIWERLLQSTVQKESLHLINGSFSNRFYEISAELGLSPKQVTANEGHITSFSDLPDNEPELVGITQNETSTGVHFPDKEIKKIRQKYPNAILALDTVSSAPAIAIPTSDIDCFYFSVQKCFGLPAGLGVWVYNDRLLAQAQAKSETGASLGSYHSLLKIHESGIKYQTPETPNGLNIFLLSKVVEDMLSKGVDQIIRETNYKAAVLYQLFNDHPKLKASVDDEEIRSKTVAVADVEGGNTELMKFTAAKGLILGSGYGKSKDSQIRIASFPTHSKEQIEMLADLLMTFK